jgi:hypothetical protein
MAYTVAAAQRRGSVGYTILNVLQLLGGSNPPAEIAFSFLEDRASTLGRGEAAPIVRAPSAHTVRAVHLARGTSICYVNRTSGLGFVAHANMGALPMEDFVEAMETIGAPPYEDVYVALAHCGESALGCEQTIANLSHWGVPENHVLRITHLFGSTFGLNNRFQIGY